MRFGGAEARGRAGGSPARSTLHVFAEIPDLQESGRAACSVAGIYVRMTRAGLLWCIYPMRFGMLCQSILRGRER